MFVHSEKRAACQQQGAPGKYQQTGGFFYAGQGFVTAHGGFLSFVGWLMGGRNLQPGKVLKLFGQACQPFAASLFEQGA